MKNSLILTTLIMLSVSKLTAQNLFFIGDKSYRCTETFTLKSNSNAMNLDVLIAKKEETGMLVLTSLTGFGALISGQVMIYLDDGTVISCIDRGINDYVDNKATTVYYLTNSEIEKMKNSNINSIRYTLKFNNKYGIPPEESNYSASNKSFQDGYIGKIRTDVPELIKELFK